MLVELICDSALLEDQCLLVAIVLFFGDSCSVVAGILLQLHSLAEGLFGFLLGFKFLLFKGCLVLFSSII